jgi:hypothetical protein
MSTAAQFNEGASPSPQWQDRRRMWSELQVSQRHEVLPAVDAYASALRKVLERGVRFATFEIEPHPVFEWYASRNLFHEMWFFQDFWSLTVPHQFMPDKLADLNFYSQSVFSWSSPFLLGGQLAWVLAQGGAYEKHTAGPVDAKRLGDAAAIELVHDDYDQVVVFESHVGWSEFFCNVAWDYTWIVIDKPRRLIHALIATDTD